VVNETHLDTRRIANYRVLLTLRDKHRSDDVELNQLKNEIASIMNEAAAVTLQHLSERLSLTDLTPLLHLLDSGFLHADLDSSLLSLPQSVLVSTHPTIVQALQQSASTPLLLQNAAKNIDARVAIPRMSALNVAAKYIDQLANGERSRHLYRVMRDIKVGKNDGIAPLIAAAPAYAKRGNRSIRIDPEHRNFIDESITAYLSPTRRSAHAAFNVYRAKLEESKLAFPPISEPTYREIVKQMRPELVAYARGGRRLRNSQASPTPVHTREVSSLIAFDSASIDHHEMNIQVVVAESTRKKFTARVWITSLVDHGSKCILAFWISFNSPSRRSVGMVLRECVRKFGGLPRIIFTDGGAEFRCDYLKALYTYINGTVCQHPEADGRSGSQVERPFGLFDTEWLAHRDGHVTNILDTREVSSSHAASTNATLTIRNLWEEACLYVEHHNSRRIGDMDTPPIELLRDGMCRFPTIMIKQEFNDEFLIFTSVDCRDYALNRQRGIHIGNKWFSHPRLFDPTLTKSSLMVRIDPANPYKVYAQVNDQWIACLSRGHDEFLMLPTSEREATAFRLLLGHAARETARKDDQVVLVGKLLDIDEKRKAEKMGFVDETSVFSPDLVENDQADSMPASTSLFAMARQADLVPLNTIIHPSKRA
jgi:hypothetical protein